MLRLLPMSDRDKDVEILALRHQLAVLHRQLGTESVRFDAGDRAFLAALLHRLPRTVLRRVRLLVRPDTVFRWHRVSVGWVNVSMSMMGVLAVWSCCRPGPVAYLGQVFGGALAWWPRRITRYG